MKSSGSRCLPTRTKAGVCRWIAGLAGDKRVERKDGGCAAAGKQSSARPLSLLAYRKQANTRAESGDAKPPLLKSSLILSAAEQCCTGEHNDFMAQI